MTRLPCQYLLLCCGLLSLHALADPPEAAVASAAPPALPAWQVLEYEQQAFFVTARSRVEIMPDSDDPGQWRLTASSSVASNSEELVLELAAADGRARYRSRLSKGKNERYKTYEFLPGHILRVRRDPPADTTRPPSDWPVSSSREIPYPAAAAGLVVTDAYALLDLAGRFLASDAAAMEVAVNTEFNFYRVRMSRRDGPSIGVNYQVSGASAVTGKRPSRVVAIAVSPLGEQPDKPDFSLLGLGGEITVLFDESGDLPLQLRGDAPRIGKAEINLKAVTLREPPA